jgi:hypothetical protein
MADQLEVETEATVTETSTRIGDEVSLSLVVACVAAVVAVSGLLLAMNASLIGDGSYYLLRAIQTGQPLQLSGRQGINLLREGPLLIARSGGVTNTQALTFFEGIGFIAFPALVWSLALVIARHSRARFTLIALTCGLCFGSVILFSVSELTLAAPLVVVATLLLTQPTSWSGTSAALVILTTGLLFFSHESIVVCALLLAGVSLYRSRAHLGPIDTKVSLIVLVLSVAVLSGAVWTLVVWPNKNSDDFLNASLSVLLLVMGSVLLVGWCILYGRVPGAEFLRWALLAFAILLTGLGIRAGIHAGAEGAYQSRSVTVVVVVVLQVVLVIDWIRVRRTDERIPDLGESVGSARVAAIFLIVVLLIPAVGATRWANVIDDFHSTVTQRTGDIPAADVRPSLPKAYVIPWTDTSLSVLLRSSDSNAVIENTGELNPFSVGSAEQQIPSQYRWGGG